MSEFTRRERYLDLRGSHKNIISIMDINLEDLNVDDKTLLYLKRILEETKENRRDISFLFEEIQNCEKKLEINQPIKNKVNFSDLSVIMSDLIDFSIKNPHVHKVGYYIKNELKFCIVFDALNFDNLNIISNLDVELSRKNSSIALSIEPFSIEETIDSNYKFFYYVKKESPIGST